MSKIYIKFSQSSNAITSAYGNSIQYQQPPNSCFRFCTEQCNITNKIKSINVELSQILVSQLTIVVDQYLDNHEQTIKGNVKEFIEAIAHRQRFVTTINISAYCDCEIYQSLASTQWEFLRYVYLSYCYIDSSGIKKVCKLGLRYLKELDLAGNIINHEGMEALAQLYCPQLIYFNISYNQIGNKGIKALCKAIWPKLTAIQLRRIEATSHSLSYFKKRNSKINICITDCIFFSHKAFELVHQLDMVHMVVKSGNDYIDSFVRTANRANINSLVKAQQNGVLQSKLKGIQGGEIDSKKYCILQRKCMIHGFRFFTGRSQRGHRKDISQQIKYHYPVEIKIGQYSKIPQIDTISILLHILLWSYLLQKIQIFISSFFLLKLQQGILKIQLKKNVFHDSILELCTKKIAFKVKQWTQLVIAGPFEVITTED